MDKEVGTKKKSSKTSRQSTPVPQEASENAEVKVVEAKAEAESSQPKVAVNGKSKAKNDKKSKSKEKSTTNGVSDVALNTNGTANGNGSLLVVDDGHPEVIEEEALVPNSEPDNDELFPELIYDETSDECNFDSSSPSFSPVGRSVTRRSQAKIIPTPETPQMLSKADTGTEVSSSPAESLERPSSQDTQSSDPAMPAIPMKDKILKLKEVYALTPRKDTPESDTISDNIIIDVDKIEETANETASTTEVTVTKTDTNYSKSRIKVSPYRRSARISDQYSTMANYSGNNTTQETDVIGDISSSSRDHSPILDSTEESTVNCSQESSHDEGSAKSYTEHLRSLKGRRSYKPLREISLRNLTVQRQRAAKADAEKNEEQMSATVSSANATIGSEPHNTLLSEASPKWTPVGHVIGRKRKQSPGTTSQASSIADSPALVVSEGSEVSENVDAAFDRPSKRQRLLGYVATPLRNLREKVTSSTPIIGRFSQTHSRTTHKETVVTTSTVDEQMPTVQGVPVGRNNEEHKWCLIM